MKALMYHYVRNYDPRLPNFRFLSHSNFRLQLDYLDREYGFANIDDWREWTEVGRSSKNTKRVTLTFDDGLIDHYNFVLPELKKRKLTAIFYVPTDPIISQRPLDVHKIHLLCGAVEGAFLLEKLYAVIEPHMITNHLKKEYTEKTYLKQNQNDPVTAIKRLLNYFISYDFRSSIIDSLLFDLLPNWEDFKLYMTTDEVRELSNSGMLIGAHTHTHPLLSKLSKKNQRNEINRSFEELHKICTPPLKTFCYPYGGFHSFDEFTVKHLKDIGTHFSFNVESRNITASDLGKSNQCLPRYDCNEFPHGTAS